MSVSLLVCKSASLSIFQTVNLSVCQPVYQSICQSICQSVCLPVSQSVSLRNNRAHEGRLCSLRKTKYTYEATYERLNDKQMSFITFSFYLNFSVDAVKLNLIAKQAVANLVFLHPLVGVVSSLRCTSNNLCDVTKIYLQPLEHVVIS